MLRVSALGFNGFACKPKYQQFHFHPRESIGTGLAHEAVGSWGCKQGLGIGVRRFNSKEVRHASRSKRAANCALWSEDVEPALNQVIMRRKEGGLPKSGGTVLGIPTIRIIVSWGL